MTREKHMLFQLLVCFGPAGPGLCANREEGNAHKMDKFDPRIVMLKATDVGT